MKALENLIDLDLVIVVILGASLAFVSPDLQGNILSGLIGFLGAKASMKIAK